MAAPAPSGRNGIETPLAAVASLTGYDLYRNLVLECGWTGSRYEQWLSEVLPRQLLDPASWPSQ